MKTKQELTKIRKKAKSDGAAFELRVRKDMTEKGWVVDKFGLNVELADTTNIDIPGELDIVKYCGKLIIAKNKWAGLNRPMMMGAGFPDFSCHKVYPSTIEVENECIKMNDAELGYFMDGIGTHKHLYAPTENNKYYKVIGVECKCDGYLSKLEREKCRWLLDNNVFSKILVASKHKIKNRIHIEYEDFEIKYGKKQNAK